MWGFTINDRSFSHPFPTMSSKFLKAKAGSHLSFLASLIGEEKDKDPKRAVLIVSDFPDVFPDDYQGYPHKERLNSRLISIWEPNLYPLPLTVCTFGAKGAKEAIGPIVEYWVYPAKYLTLGAPVLFVRSMMKHLGYARTTDT